jgi:hypothetical protein
MTQIQRYLRSWYAIGAIAVAVGAWLTDLASSGVSHRDAMIFTALAGGAAALGEGIAKQNSDVLDWWKVPETYTAFLAAAIVVVGGLTDVIGAKLALELAGGLGLILKIARGIAQAPPVVTGNLTPNQFIATQAGPVHEPPPRG